MESLINYPVPTYISILFLLAIPLPIVLILLLIRSAFPERKSLPLIVISAVTFAVYVGYVLFMGKSGMFAYVCFPPMVILLTTVPFATFLFVVVGRTSWYKQFLNHVSLARLVSIHIFRLIGIFFILLALNDALPAWFGLIAGMGDIAVACSAIWVAQQIKRKYKHANRLIWYWNTFGLIDILFTALSANVLAKLSIDEGAMGVDALAMFPFYFIPALAPPLIIFLHYSTYLKLRLHSGTLS